MNGVLVPRTLPDALTSNNAENCVIDNILLLILNSKFWRTREGKINTKETYSDISIAK